MFCYKNLKASLMKFSLYNNKRGKENQLTSSLNHNYRPTHKQRLYMYFILIGNKQP